MTIAPAGVLQQMARGFAARDAETLAALYADDAEVRSVDRRNPPSSPKVLQGRAAIAADLRDQCLGQAEHRVGDEIEGGDRVAFTVACRYPDGLEVLCASVAHLDSDGRIVRQTNVSAWDE